MITKGNTMTERMNTAASKANTARTSIIGLSPKNEITADNQVAGSVQEKTFDI